MRGGSREVEELVGGAYLADHGRHGKALKMGSSGGNIRLFSKDAFPGSLCGGATQAQNNKFFSSPLILYTCVDCRQCHLPVSRFSSPNCHDDVCYALPLAVLYIYNISLCTSHLPSLAPPPPTKTSQRVFSGRNSPMRYQSLTLALCSYILCIVARPTSGYALKSSLQRREDKKEPEKCFCFKLNDKPDPPVTCMDYVMSDKDDGDCKPADNARRCCDNECDQHGCDKPGQHFFGFDSAAGPNNSMFGDFGKKTSEEWEKAQNAANGKGFKTNKELEEEAKKKEDAEKDKKKDKEGEPIEGEDEDEEEDEEDEDEDEEDEDEDKEGDNEDTDKEGDDEDKKGDSNKDKRK